MEDDFTANDLNTLAKTIYGEAREETFKTGGIAALIAVANVIVNRKKNNSSKPIAEICTEQFPCWKKEHENYEDVRTVTEENYVFRICLEVARNVLSKKWPNLVENCYRYHHVGLGVIKPFWAAYQSPNRIFGHIWFYHH